MTWILIGVGVAAAGGIGWYVRKRYLDKKYGKKRKIVTQYTDKNGKVRTKKITERVKDEDRGYSNADMKKARKIVKDSVEAGELKMESTLQGMVDAAEKLDSDIGKKEEPKAVRPSFEETNKKKATKRPVRKMPKTSTKETKKKATKKKSTKKKPTEAKKKATKKKTKKKPDDKDGKE